MTSVTTTVTPVQDQYPTVYDDQYKRTIDRINQQYDTLAQETYAQKVQGEKGMANRLAASGLYNSGYSDSQKIAMANNYAKVNASNEQARIDDINAVEDVYAERARQQAEKDMSADWQFSVRQAGNRDAAIEYYNKQIESGVPKYQLNQIWGEIQNQYPVNTAEDLELAVRDAGSKDAAMKLYEQKKTEGANSSDLNDMWYQIQKQYPDTSVEDNILAVRDAGTREGAMQIYSQRKAEGASSEELNNLWDEIESQYPMEDNAQAEMVMSVREAGNKDSALYLYDQKKKAGASAKELNAMWDEIQAQYPDVDTSADDIAYSVRSMGSREAAEQLYTELEKNGASSSTLNKVWAEIEKQYKTVDTTADDVIMMVRDLGSYSNAKAYYDKRKKEGASSAELNKIWNAIEKDYLSTVAVSSGSSGGSKSSGGSSSKSSTEKETAPTGKETTPWDLPTGTAVKNYTAYYGDTPEINSAIDYAKKYVSNMKTNTNLKSASQVKQATEAVRDNYGDLAAECYERYVTNNGGGKESTPIDSIKLDIREARTREQALGFLEAAKQFNEYTAAELLDLADYVDQYFPKPAPVTPTTNKTTTTTKTSSTSQASNPADAMNSLEAKKTAANKNSKTLNVIK